MPSMKAGYSRSVSRGSGSSLKYSFNVPAMALMSMSLSITRMSLVSADQTDTRTPRLEEVNNRTAALHPSSGCIVIGESLTGVKSSFESLDVGGHP